MIKSIVIALVVVGALAAPSDDKMTKIPVLFVIYRDTLRIIRLLYTRDTWMSRIPIGLFIMSSWSLKMDREIRILLLCG
jgi:hypothetical protein